MGATSKHELPWPALTAYVKDGASAIRELAEAVDERLGGALFRATVEGETVADSTDDTLDLDLTGDDSEIFTDAEVMGNLIRYTGDTSVVATVAAQVVWEGSGAGRRRLAIVQDGTEVVWVADTPDGTSTYAQVVTWPVKLAPGDTIGLVVRQTSGGPLDVESGKLRCIVHGIQPA